MHPQVLVGLGLAVACAIGTNLGGLWKQKGAVATSPVDIRRPLQSTVALFRSKWWTIGWLAAAVGWGLHVGALALAPISLGQAVISGGIVLLGVFAERFFGFRLSTRQWVVLVLVAVGMAFLAASAHSVGNRSHFELLAIAGFEAGAVALSAACILACRVNRLCDHDGVLLGTAAGLLFGLSDVSIKAVSGSGGGVLAIVSPWSLTALAAGIAAFFAAARSLQIGEGISVITSTAAAANVLGIVGGVVVFAEPLGGSELVIAGRVSAFALVVVAVALFPVPHRAHRAISPEPVPADAREAVAGT